MTHRAGGLDPLWTHTGLSLILTETHCFGETETETGHRASAFRSNPPRLGESISLSVIRHTTSRTRARLTSHRTGALSGAPYCRRLLLRPTAGLVAIILLAQVPSTPRLTRVAETRRAAELQQPKTRRTRRPNTRPDSQLTAPRNASTGKADGGSGWAFLAFATLVVAFSISRYWRINFFGTSGIAAGVRVGRSTDVTGTGGEVFGSGGNVHSTPVSVSSTSSRDVEFFVKSGNEEQPVTLSDSAFAVRDGHRVTVVFARRGRGSGYPSWLRNHDTGEEIKRPSSIRSLRLNYFGRQSWDAQVAFMCAVVWLVQPWRPSLHLSGILGFVEYLLLFGVTAVVLIKLVNLVGDRRVLMRARRFGELISRDAT